MLTLEKFSPKQEDVTLFENFGVTLFQGSIVEIKGNNGVGKTSLLKEIVKLKDSSGIVKFNKKILDADSWLHNINYIGHKLGLRENKTVYETLAFFASLHGFELALESAVHTLGLNNVLDKKISELSAGVKKRVSLSKLLLKGSPIWILDEPFANLDAAYKDILVNMILARAYQNGIIIFTSHEKIDIKNSLVLNLGDLNAK